MDTNEYLNQEARAADAASNWECRLCNHSSNPGGSKQCEHCNAPRPEADTVAAPTAALIESERFNGRFGSRLRDATGDLRDAFDYVQSAMREAGNSPAMESVYDALLRMHSVLLHLVFIADDLDPDKPVAVMEAVKG